MRACIAESGESRRLFSICLTLDRVVVWTQVSAESLAAAVDEVMARHGRSVAGLSDWFEVDAEDAA